MKVQGVDNKLGGELGAPIPDALSIYLADRNHCRSQRI